MHLNVCVCQHVEFVYIGTRYTFGGNTGLGLTQDLLILHRNSIYNEAYLPMSMDLPSVFKIHKIQEQSVSTMHLAVCQYSHQQLAFSKSCHLAIIAKIFYQIARHTTLTPTYNAIKRETSRKPSIREKPTEFLGSGHQCKVGLFPSGKCNVYESAKMFYQDCEVVPQVLYPCSKLCILLWHL